MAFYRRKKGMDLWKKGTFEDYDFCICCKAEVATGEEGFVSVKTRPRLKGSKEPTTRSKLCKKCQREWSELNGCNKPLCEIPRFKIE